MNLFQKYVTPSLSRLIGALVVAVSPWVAETFGIEISQEMHDALVATAVGLIMYLVSHRLGSMVLNPSDTAKPPESAEPTNAVTIPQSPPPVVVEVPVKLEK